jgi:hypothetical protein
MRSRFKEEFLSFEWNVSLDTLREKIYQGSMMLPSVQTALMGLKKLRDLSILLENQYL